MLCYALAFCSYALNGNVVLTWIFALFHSAKIGQKVCILKTPNLKVRAKAEKLIIFINIINKIYLFIIIIMVWITHYSKKMTCTMPRMPKKY